MKLSDIMTIYTVAIDILAIALLLTADCFAHSLITAGMGVMGLVTWYFACEFRNCEKAIVKLEIYVGGDRKERKEEYETNKADRR